MSEQPTRLAAGSPEGSRQSQQGTHQAQQRIGVAVVGSLHYDIMLRTPHLPRLGETLIGSDWWWKPGGKGGNQAMAAARHGGTVHMIGALGADEFGAKLRESLGEAGVNHDLVRTAARGSGMSVALVEAAGDYSAVVVSGANLTIDAAQSGEAADALSRAKILILQNEISDAANVAAARIVRAAGGRVVYNAAPARQPAPEMAALTDVLVVNAVEAEMLGGGVVHDLASASAAARQLQALAPNIVVTAGGDGLALCHAGECSTLPAHAVENAQTHGAGDAFIGALAAVLAASEDLPGALAYANAAAALHVGAGAEAAGIGPAEVQAFLAARAVGWSG